MSGDGEGENFDYLNRSNVSLRTPGSARRLNRSRNEHEMSTVSIDHEYLGRVDQIEAQNKSFVDEIAKLQ